MKVLEFGISFKVTVRVGKNRGDPFVVDTSEVKTSLQEPEKFRGVIKEALLLELFREIRRDNPIIFAEEVAEMMGNKVATILPKEFLVYGELAKGEPN